MKTILISIFCGYLIINIVAGKTDWHYTFCVRVQNVPLSADDGIIERAITLQDKKVITVNREKLRVDSKLTNCETGDRIVICVKFDKPLPRKMKIGKYLARVVHFGQPKPTDIFLCSKCLQHGHSIRNCPNDWACRKCKKSGHQVLECPDFYNKPNEEQISDSQETIPTDKHDTTISDTQQTLPPEHLDTLQTMPPEQHSDSELENDKQTQSQSISTTIREHGDEKEEDSEDKTKKGRKNKNKAKQDSENSDTQNKQQDSEVKDKKQQNKKDGSSAKQADMTKYITPNRKAGGRNQNRTPPSPPQRGVHKQQRV